MEVIISYAEYGKLVDKLYQEIPNNKFKGIYTVPRGGYPIATHLAHWLEIPILNEVQLKGYNLSTEILLVDDIVHKGITIKRLHAIKNVAVIFINREFIDNVTKGWKEPLTPTIYFAEVVAKDAWVVFPWENQMRKGIGRWIF